MIGVMAELGPLVEIAESEVPQTRALVSGPKSWQEAEQFLRDTYGGGSATKETSPGGRVLDNLTPNGVAQESKFGSQSLDNDTAMQIAKDIELMRTPSSGVKQVEWHFFPNANGGPARRSLKLYITPALDVFAWHF